MASAYSKTESALLRLLAASLRSSGGAVSLPLDEAERAQVLTLAQRHEVLPLLGTVWDADALSEPQRLAVEEKTAQTVHKSIQLQILNARLTALLDGAGIRAVTLKGCTVARLYPVPEYRKSSDIDLFVPDPAERERAMQILQKDGFRLSGEWHANHHVILRSEKGEVVEMHDAWTECFQNKHLNRSLERLQKESGQHCRLLDCGGFSVYAYEPAWQAFYLLLHMLQHFVGSGFGLRNLCDWVVLWTHEQDAKTRETFCRLTRESGTESFAAAVSAVCVRYLGLETPPVPVLAEPDTADALLRDILDAGEFGYNESARMVGMDGSSPAAYLREFHHQMHINFPRAGRLVPLWPGLWLATLTRFLYNNQKLHRAPVSAILRKAGQRGRLVRRLTAPK